MKLINTERFYLKGTANRWIHLATVHDSVKEYMCFMDLLTNQTYIEEITGGGGPYRIEDDSLAEALTNFLTRKGILNIGRPTLPDNQWLRNKK